MEANIEPRDKKMTQVSLKAAANIVSNFSFTARLCSCVRKESEERNVFFITVISFAKDVPRKSHI